MIILSGGRINFPPLQDCEVLEGRVHMLLTYLSIPDTSTIPRHYGYLVNAG